MMTIPHFCSKHLSKSVFFVIFDDPIRVYISLFGVVESTVEGSVENEHNFKKKEHYTIDKSILANIVEINNKIRNMHNCV